MGFHVGVHFAYFPVCLVCGVLVSSLPDLRSRRVLRKCSHEFACFLHAMDRMFRIYVLTFTCVDAGHLVEFVSAIVVVSAILVVNVKT